MYRTTGIFFSGSSIYTTYNLTVPGERLWKDVELSFLTTLQRAVRDSYQIKSPRYGSIFYMPKAKTIYEFLFPDRKSYRFMPGLIYNMYYMLQLDKGGPATSLILTPDWKEKTNSLLIENAGGKEGDGTSDERLAVYNFLGNNIGLMRTLVPEIKREKRILIVHDWQVDIVKRLFGDNNALRVVEEDMLEELIKDIGRI